MSLSKRLAGSGSKRSMQIINTLNQSFQADQHLQPTQVWLLILKLQFVCPQFIHVCAFYQTQFHLCLLVLMCAVVVIAFRTQLFMEISQRGLHEPNPESNAP
jgi:hypothetical protein